MGGSLAEWSDQFPVATLEPPGQEDSQVVARTLAFEHSSRGDQIDLQLSPPLAFQPLADRREPGQLT